MHLDDFVFGHFESNHPYIASGNTGIDLLFRKRQRSRQLRANGVVVGKRLAPFLCLVAQCLQLRRSIECIVCPTGIDELFGIFEIYVATLALTIRRMRTAYTDTLVDFDAAPAQRFDDICLGTLDKPLRVGILDT